MTPNRRFAFLRADPRLLAFGFLLTFSSSFGQTFFISLFAGDIRATFDLSNGAFGAAYSVGTVASAVAMTWTGAWIDRVDLRAWTFVLLAAMAIACLAMGASQNFVMLAFAIFLLRQTGQGLATHTAMTSQARYHHDARGRAVATAGLGFPLAEAVFPILAVALAVAIGWRQSWFVFAAAIAFVLLPASLWLLRGHGRRHERYLETIAVPTTAPGEGAGTRLSVPGRQWTRRMVLKDPRFYLLLPVILAPPFIFTGVFFHQVHLAEVKGWGMDVWATTYAGFAISSVLSGFGFGAVIDRVGAARVLPALLPPLGIACLLITVFDSVPAAWGYMLVGGLTAGMMATFFGVFWAEVYGTRHLGAIRSLATALMVLSTALSPVVMGVLIDWDIALETQTLACAIYCLAASVLAWAAARLYASPDASQ